MLDSRPAAGWGYYMCRLEEIRRERAFRIGKGVSDGGERGDGMCGG